MRVVLVCPDLLFGSKLEGGLQAAGHEVTRASDEPGAWGAVGRGVDVLVVDLGADDFDGAVLVDSLRADGALRGVGTLGFYPHVEQETRRRAEEVGFDLVVPRSRMAREAQALVDRVVRSAPRR